MCGSDKICERDAPRSSAKGLDQAAMRIDCEPSNTPPGTEGIGKSKGPDAAIGMENSIVGANMTTRIENVRLTSLGRRATVSARLWREASGQELLEMAFVLSLLMMLLIGIFWAGRAYNIYTTINRAAREGARAAVAPSCATCGNAFPSNATVQGVVDSILSASNLQTSSSGNITVTIQQHQALNLDPYNASATWTVVSISYPFQFYIPFVPLAASTLTISSQAQMLEEGS
jgi:Flp pilus assembly protein TadG